MRLVCAAALLMTMTVTACDPALNMAGAPQSKRTIDDCQEAVTHLHDCCPQYKSYVSCTVMESWAGAGSSDWSAGQSRCLRQASCETMEKSVTGEKSLCGVTFRDNHCK